MGKHLAGRDQAGMSAAIQFRRARRVARRRRLVRAVAAAAAMAPLAMAFGPGRWWPVAMAVGAGFLVGVLPGDRDPQRWSRGAAGEVATALLLAALPRRFVVLHDRRLPGGRANVDHLVIGPTGVWVVDSKAYRAELRVRRGRVWAGGHEVPTAPAASEADRVAALLEVAVTAIVAVHGRGLRRRGKTIGGVRVIPADRLVRTLRRGRRRVNRAQAAILAHAADRALPPAGPSRTLSRTGRPDWPGHRPRVP